MWRGIRFLVRLLVVGWATLAIYYSNLPWIWLRSLGALAFLAFSIWAVWLSRRRHVGWVFVGAFLGVVIWWNTIRPSPEGEWQPEVAVMPRAVIDGDRVRITSRNCDYRTTGDFTVRYEDREVCLTNLTSVDFFLSYWRPGPVAHTFLSFNFDNAPPVCISIEIKAKAGETFSVIPTLFKQFQLIYVVGDERDLVRVRINFRHEEVYLYRIRTSPETARQLFLVYLDRINTLADHPEFYHLLANSCTVNIVRYANAAGRNEGRFDIRHLLNGYVDHYLYSRGLVDTSLPFAELRRRSRINETAQAADNAADFSELIRKSVPTAHP
jgi:hypothetical protein